MSQRLTSLQNPMQYSKSRIIGWSKGCPVWSIAGGRPEEDKPEDKPKDTPPEEDDNDDDDDDEEGDDDHKGGDEPVTREEFNKLFKRMQAADRAKTEAEKRVKEFEDKDKSELEREKARADEAEAKLAKATEAVRSQAIRLAFLSTSSVEWHDVDDALAFAMKDESLRDLELDDDGAVDKRAVKKVADDLAKAKPYLVKKDKDKDDNDGKGPSGHNPGGGKDKKQLDRDKLMEKYPALRR